MATYSSLPLLRAWRASGSPTPSARTPGYNLSSDALGSLYNPVAAVPSLHFGYALIVGLAIAALARPRSIRIAGALYPVLMLLVIVATGNHFFFDAAAGGLVVVAGWLVARTLVRPVAWSRPPTRGAHPALRRTRSTPRRSAHPPPGLAKREGRGESPRLRCGGAGVAQLGQSTRLVKRGAKGSNPFSGFSSCRTLRCLSEQRHRLKEMDHPKAEHPKAIGDRTTLAAMLALTTLGYNVSMPFGENTRYDLIVEDDGTIERVQCKTGRLRDGVVVFRTASSYAHHPNPKPRQRHYQGQIDTFAVFCPETCGVYLIPIDSLPSGRWLSPGYAPAQNGQCKRIRDASTHEVARLSVSPSEKPHAPRSSLRLIRRVVDAQTPRTEGHSDWRGVRRALDI